MSAHRFYVGHVLDVLKMLSDESVHCVVTSPPYWGLRDYGLPPAAWPAAEYSPMPGMPLVRIPAWEGQLGLEPSPEMYVGHLVQVFREVRRVLRRDGTLWLNLGDSYAGYWGEKYAHKPFGEEQSPDQSTPPNKNTPPWQTIGIKPKDLIGIPWRAAFALQADGWWLRSDVVWEKPNPLPESVTDRPTKAHEYLFLLARSPKYFYDADAVREPWNPRSIERDQRGYKGTFLKRTREADTRDNRVNGLDGQKGNYVAGRNKRSVWHIATESFPGAHFATFPQALAEPCIKAGTSEYGCCPSCGASWVREVKTRHAKHPNRGKMGAGQFELFAGAYEERSSLGNAVIRETAGWHPACRCPENDGSSRCVILDPFGGAGTAALVADGLGRDSIYIDLKREYAEMAMSRLGIGKKLFVDCELVDLAAAAEGCG